MVAVLLHRSQGDDEQRPLGELRPDGAGQGGHRESLEGAPAQGPAARLRVVGGRGPSSHSVVRKIRAASVISARVTTATESNWTPIGTFQPNQVITGSSRCASAAVSERCSSTKWRIGWTT